MRRANSNTAYTINAAANAIASDDTHTPPQPSPQKSRWGRFWSIYWCFGSQKNKKRIRHAALVPEPESVNSVSASHNSTQASTRSLPFVAPPSSPASFLPSGSPSAMQSPASSLTHNAVSSSMFSPGGPSSIFAIGPYAHETQLVSPPVFSTYTTEPSTAPFTPPPESVHLTTPSSPEVPIAQLLDLNMRNGETNRKFLSAHYEFSSYQFQPGSPIGQLISPSSGISGSGTSSPYLGHDFSVSGSQFLEFWKGDRSKVSSLDRIPAYDWESRQGSGTLTPNSVRRKSPDEFPLDCPPNFLHPVELSANKIESIQGSCTLTPDAVTPRSHDDFPLDRARKILDLKESSLKCSEGSDTSNDNGVRIKRHDRSHVGIPTCVLAAHEIIDNSCQNGQLVDHRVSFELTLKDVVRGVEKELPVSSDPVLTSAEDLERAEYSSETVDGNRCKVGETADEKPENPPFKMEESGQSQKYCTVSFGSGTDFDFDYADGADPNRPIVTSDWWSNKKFVGKDHETIKKWFFPVLQPGVS